MSSTDVYWDYSCTPILQPEAHKVMTSTRLQLSLCPSAYYGSENRIDEWKIRQALIHLRFATSKKKPCRKPFEDENQNRPGIFLNTWRLNSAVGIASKTTIISTLKRPTPYIPEVKFAVWVHCTRYLYLQFCTEDASSLTKEKMRASSWKTHCEKWYNI